MDGKRGLIWFLPILIVASFCSVCNNTDVKAAESAIIVPDDYSTIQEDINNADPGDVIHVWSGTYHEHIVINKTITLVGEKVNATRLDGNGTGVVVEISADNVTFTGFSVANGGAGSWPECNILVRGDFATISENNITNNSAYGVLIDYSSSGNIIVDNTIADNGIGIHLWHSTYGDDVCENSLISNNVIANNSLSGISLLESEYNSIVGNTLLSNNVGVLVSDSRHNEISLNTIRNNGLGIRLEYGGGSGSTIYNNNFVNNTKQAEIVSEYCQWNQAYPVCGNYWSDNNGTDLYSGPGQNVTGSDGINDAPRVIDVSNQDDYPLMGMFYSSDISFLPGLAVTLISNSTVSLFSAVPLITSIDPPSSMPAVMINFTDESGFGFCRVSIPHAYANISGTPVTIDCGDTAILCPNYTLYDDGTCRGIYFAYNHSIPPDHCQMLHHFRVVIIPEYPLILILLLLITATLPIIIHYKRKKSRIVYSS